MTTIPSSAADRWDEAAEKIRGAKGKWVLITEGAKVTRHQKAREALARRGLEVELQSRLGHGTTSERPWIGWNTWAKVNPR